MTPAGVWMFRAGARWMPGTMPLYSYRCKACDRTFETLVRSSDIPACTSCGSRDLERLVSIPAPEGKSAGVLKGARAQAAREGHFSNYSRSELKRR
jgi:putative FmdB family regulatory protein